MSFFPDERAAELRDVFFESAQEILQALNDCGLELEKHPGDAEILRKVLRAVHTLKGDSAACGFEELSKLGHDLEDVLTPERAAEKSSSLAELVLTAADTFHAMLAAYRDNLQPPAGNALRERIQQLLGTSPRAAQSTLPDTRFSWNEYEQLMIAEAAGRNETVYNVAMEIHPDSPLRAAALQLVRNVLHGCGTILALRPDDNVTIEDVKIIEAAVASERSRAWIEKKCRIPSVVSGIVIEKIELADQAEHDLPDLEPAAGHATAPAAPQSASRKNAQKQGATPQRTAAQPAVLASAENSLRVDSARIDKVMNLVGELIIGKSMLHQTLLEFDKRFARDPLHNLLVDALAFQSRVLDELQKSVMKIRMVPVEHLFRRFPRIVRDVAKARGKDVALVISGQNTDLDKGILDSLSEPLTHLVRNAVDHGIGPSEERVAAGKPARGTVRLKAYHQGNQVVIEVGDDGRGIDSARLVAKAIGRGILKPEEAARLSPSEALNLVFQPGLSTATSVDQISGRGVGMDVVRTALEQLKGTVKIESKPGVGTTFFLLVPLTLASIQALLFRVGEQLYAVPLSTVLEITRATEEDIHRVEDHEIMRLRDQVLTVVRLDRLARTRPAEAPKRLYVVIVGVAERKFGLIVDKMVGEEELVMKALDGCLFDAEMVSGASILGDGRVVLILNLSAVVGQLAKAQLVEATA